MRRRIQIVNRVRRGTGTGRSHRQPFRYWAATVLPSVRLVGSRTRRRQQPSAAPDPIALGAATWLACGIVLLGLTPLPLRDAHLGWSFTYWALAAPSVVLLARCIRRRTSWIRGE